MNLQREVSRDNDINWTNPPRIGSVGRVFAREGGWVALVWPEGTGPEATEMGWWPHDEMHLAVRAVENYWNEGGD